MLLFTAAAFSRTGGVFPIAPSAPADTLFQACKRNDASFHRYFEGSHASNPVEERRRVAAVPILAYVAIAAAVSRTRRPIAEVRSPEDGAALLNGAKGRRAKI